MAYTVAVRALSEFTARSGDLDLRFTPSPSAVEGMEGHALVQGRRGATYEREVRLSGGYEDLTVRGRADGWDAQAGRLEEIKTYRGRIDAVRPHHQALHWAQARVYGHLLCQERGLAQLEVALVYFNIGTQEEIVLVETCSAQDLQAFFEAQCRRFLQWARQEAQHRQTRDAALQALSFPMPAFRAGQRALAVAVYRSACAEAPGQCLLAEAPTGIGKTLGTVFPMLKAAPNAGIDKVFFLTAKGTGHALALQALGQLDVPSLRVLDLQARDRMCEHPDKACHGDACPLARGFFDRLPAARAAIVGQAAAWEAETVRQVAQDHGICPYYLSQELVRWSDVVVADYHYYYDSAASLYALTLHLGWKIGLLVDEAHNLLERARSMYSAELSQWELREARTVATGAVRKALEALQRQWRLLNLAQAQVYQAYDAPPAAFLGAVQRVIRAIADVQAEHPLMPGDPVLTLYWSLLHFAQLAEQFDRHALFDIRLAQEPLQPAGPAKASRRVTVPYSSICLRNVVPAPHLQPRHAAAQASVLFSGTLSPSSFYCELLGLPERVRTLEVPAPFAAQQLQVQLAAHLSTRYRDRAGSLQELVRIMVRQYRQQPGNYLGFVSSFEYLEQVAAALHQEAPEVPTWCQTPGMDEHARRDFLGRFQPQGQGIGLAVLGGAFSEGVDLPGRRLIGAFIATLGLPQVNPVNDAMMQALRHYGLGRKAYDYVYLLPGLRKVVQAAGRVIRTEEDEGVIVLLDERYASARIQALLPRWWPAPSRIAPLPPRGRC